MLAVAGEDGLENEMSADDLRAAVVHWAVARPARALRDVRVDTYIRPFEEHWLRRILFRDARSYSHVLIASLIANTLALAGVRSEEHTSELQSLMRNSYAVF